MARKDDGLLEKGKKKIKAGLNYVNDNINPLTSKKSKAAGASYISKAKKGSMAGKMTNADTRMDRLSDSKKRRK